MNIVVTDRSGLLDQAYLDLFTRQANTALAQVAQHTEGWNPTWTIDLVADVPRGPGMVATTTNDGYEPTGATAHGLPVYAPGTPNFTTTIFLSTFLIQGFSLSETVGVIGSAEYDTIGMLRHEIARGLGIASALQPDGTAYLPFVSSYDARVSVLPGLGAYFHASDGETFALADLSLPGTQISTTLTWNQTLSVAEERGVPLSFSQEDLQILAATNPVFHIGLIGTGIGEPL